MHLDDGDLNVFMHREGRGGQREKFIGDLRKK